jgi:CBS domain-containing protein
VIDLAPEPRLSWVPLARGARKAGFAVVAHELRPLPRGLRMSDPVGSVLKQKGHQVWSIPPDASVYEAIALMSARRIGALLVMQDDRLEGIVSERDYARKVILKGKASKHTRVEEIMTRTVVTVDPECRVDDCMRIMTKNRIRHLPVVDGDKVVGVLSIGDLVKWIINEQEETIHHLENFITGKYPC